MKLTAMMAGLGTALLLMGIVTFGISTAVGVVITGAAITTTGGAAAVGSIKEGIDRFRLFQLEESLGKHLDKKMADIKTKKGP